MLDNIVHSIFEFVVRYGLWGIFLLMFAENMGFPLPTEIGFIVGQSMVLAGKSTYLDIFLIILLGKTSASIITYIIGRYFAKKVKYIQSDSNRIKNAQAIFALWMKKYGNFAVFISRLVGYIRPWSSYLAGIGEIKPVPFIIYNITGSATIIITTMFVLGGVVELWRKYSFLRPTLALAMLVAFFGFWIFISIYIKRKRIHR